MTRRKAARRRRERPTIEVNGKQWHTDEPIMELPAPVLPVVLETQNGRRGVHNDAFRQSAAYQWAVVDQQTKPRHLLYAKNQNSNGNQTQIYEAFESDALRGSYRNNLYLNRNMRIQAFADNITLNRELDPTTFSDPWSRENVISIIEGLRYMQNLHGRYSQVKGRRSKEQVREAQTALEKILVSEEWLNGADVLGPLLNGESDGNGSITRKMYIRINERDCKWFERLMHTVLNRYESIERQYDQQQATELTQLFENLGGSTT